MVTWLRCQALFYSFTKSAGEPLIEYLTRSKRRRQNIQTASETGGVSYGVFALAVPGLPFPR